MHRRTLLLVAALLVAACSQSTGDHGPSARIALGSPTTLDPAALGDAGSAGFAAQLFESLTAFDTDRELRPALAESWRIEEGGTRVVFHLRPDLTFSDGSPLRAADVVRSWLRLIDPASPSPLATLLFDVRGAPERARGEIEAGEVGLKADEAANDVIVDLVRPAADFVHIVSGPSFGIVPPGVGTDGDALVPGESFVGSGGYRLIGQTDRAFVLEANPRYWAGPPAIAHIEAVEDLGGGSGVEAFEADELDYVGIGGFDASWIAYDAELGPQLREVPSLSTDYYGFDTTRPPFDDVRVRQAVAAAVDWRRIARLSLPDEAGVATSMVPPGIPGRSDRDVVPTYDPDRARALLAEAGYPGGAGFPEVTLMTGGTGYDEAIVAELDRELGITRGGRGHGLRGVLRAARHRSAADVGAVVGRRLPGTQRFPGRAAGNRGHEQLRRLELARVRRRDRGRGLAGRSGRGGPRLRSGRGHRAARRAGRADQLRHRLGAGP